MLVIVNLNRLSGGNRLSRVWEAGSDLAMIELGIRYPHSLRRSQMLSRRLLPVALFVGLFGLTSALPSAAQNTTSNANTSAARTQERDMDWGWLGLLGLVGLLGLRRKTDEPYYRAGQPAK
jgi:MYXO-CTERM domain-containing protein